MVWTRSTHRKYDKSMNTFGREILAISPVGTPRRRFQNDVESGGGKEDSRVWTGLCT
jgi:hypothetical protein